MSGKKHRVIGIILGSLLLASSSLTSAAEPTTRDITKTEKGRAAASAASERFAMYGVRVGADQLNVSELADGSLLVGPAGAVVTKATFRTLANGSTEVATEIAIEPTTALPPADPGIMAASAPAWGWVDGGCWARSQNATGWMDVCAHHYKLFNDVDATYDYWTAHVFGVAEATFPYAFTSAGVGTSRYNGPTQYWVDWAPRSDSTLNCQPIGLGVSALGFGLSFTHQQCETWDMTKGTAAAGFNNYWRKGFFYVTGSRETAMAITTKVKSSRPSYYVSWIWTTDRVG